MNFNNRTIFVLSNFYNELNKLTSSIIELIQTELPENLIKGKEEKNLSQSNACFVPLDMQDIQESESGGVAIGVIARNSIRYNLAIFHIHTTENIRRPSLGFQIVQCNIFPLSTQNIELHTRAILSMRQEVVKVTEELIRERQTGLPF